MGWDTLRGGSIPLSVSCFPHFFFFFFCITCSHHIRIHRQTACGEEERRGRTKEEYEGEDSDSERLTDWRTEREKRERERQRREREWGQRRPKGIKKKGGRENKGQTDRHWTLKRRRGSGGNWDHITGHFFLFLHCTMDRVLGGEGRREKERKREWDDREPPALLFALRSFVCLFVCEWMDVNACVVCVRERKKYCTCCIYLNKYCESEGEWVSVIDGGYFQWFCPVPLFPCFLPSRVVVVRPNECLPSSSYCFSTSPF